MEAFVVACPRCQAKFRIRNPDHIGKQVRCRKCESFFDLKSPTAARRTKAASAVSVEDDFFEDEIIEDGVEIEEEDFTPVSRAPARPLGGRLPRKRGAGGSGKRNGEIDPEEEAIEVSTGTQLSRPLIIVFGLGGILTLGAILFGVSRMIGGGGSKGFAVPVNYAKFESNLKGVRCEYPEGWVVKQGGGKSGIPAWAKFEQDDIYISIRGSNAGSAMGSIAMSAKQATGGLGDAIAMEPAMDIHLFLEDRFAGEFSNYQEEGKPVLIDTQLGKGAQSVFTTSGLFGSKQRGYRTTLLTNQFQYTVLCLSPQKRFDQMRPAFDHVISTIKVKGR